MPTADDGDDSGPERVEALADRPLTEPHASRLLSSDLRRAEILSRHAAALEATASGYIDPETGLFVLTAAFLRDRGYCCERGCRHCPYVV